MKKILISIGCVVALALSASSAQAVTILTIGDSFFMGSVDPGNGSPETEADLLNTLAGLTSGQNTTIGGIDYHRTTNTLCGFSGACPDADASLGIGQGTTNNTGINATDWTFLKAKYGNTMVVWYVAAINDTVNIPGTCGSGSASSTDCFGESGGGLSHWILYNPTPPTVPDGGTTISLLGFGLLGLGYLRRRKQ